MTAGRTPRNRALDADTTAALDACLAPAQDGDESLIARVKARVMAAVQQDASAPNRTVRAADSHGWEVMAPGLERKVLWDSDGARSCMLRVAPGVVVPSHMHRLDEECVVLEGSIRIGRDLVLQAGDFHVGRRGSRHEDTTTDTGAIVYLRGAVEA